MLANYLVILQTSADRVRIMAPYRHAFNIPLLTILSFYLLSSISVWADEAQQASDLKEVAVSVFLVDMSQVDTANQSFQANIYYHLKWHDSSLAFQGSKPVIRPLSEIWNPRLQLVNQQQGVETLPSIVEVSPNGDVIYRQRIIGTFAQSLYLQDFPFDTQVFHVQLVSVGSDKVRLVQDKTIPSGIGSNITAQDWRITRFQAAPFLYHISPERAKEGFVISVSAKRKAGYFVTKVIVPLILIVAMSWLVFWIPANDIVPRISVSVTSMLTMIAHYIAVSSTLPKVSYL